MANLIRTAGNAWEEVYTAPFNGIIKLTSGGPKAIGCVGVSPPSDSDEGVSIGRTGVSLVILPGENLYLRSYQGQVTVALVPFDVIPADYLYNVSLGRIPNAFSGFVVGQNEKTGTAGFETVADQGGKYTYLTENTQLYVSSTSPLDVGISVAMQGLDDSYTPITLFGTTNGQAQAPLSLPDAFRVESFFVTSSTPPVGELYLSESGDLTNGIPNDATKIKAKIPLSTDTAGNIVDTGNIYASDNFSHIGIKTVPAGFVMPVLRIQAGTRKDEHIKMGGRIRPPGNGDTWFNRNPIHVYQSQASIVYSPPLVVPEKYDLEFMSIGGGPDTLSQIQVFFTLEKIP